MALPCIEIIDGCHKTKGFKIETIRAALKSDTDECIPWPHRRYKSGHGQMKVAGHGVSASRVTCILAHGAPPTLRHDAAHSCGNGHLGCINPRHIRWATRAENQADRIAHGTMLRGQQVNTCTMDADQVQQIRRMLDAGLQATLVARLTKVGVAAVYAIKYRKSWKWLPWPAS